MSPWWGFAVQRRPQYLLENGVARGSQKVVNLVVMDTSPRKLSVSLALEGLREASERVWELETQLTEARRFRDELVADAAQHVSVNRVSLITKLSRQYIYRISPGKLKND